LDYLTPFIILRKKDELCAQKADMDFNLKDYLNETFSITNDVSVPIIISVIIFLIGGLAGSVKNFLSTWLLRRKIRKSFRNIIFQVERTSSIKSRRLNEYYPTLIVDNNDDWTYKYNPVTYIDIAFSQEYSEVFSAFISNYRYNSVFKIKCFNKVWSILENLKFSEQRVLTELDNFNHKIILNQDRYKDFLEELRKDNDNLITFVKGRNIPPTEIRTIDYIKERDAIFYAWQQMARRIDLANTHDHLIVPLRALNRQYQDVPFSNEQNSILLPATYEYAEMLKTLEVYRSTFYNYYRVYSSSSKILKFCLKKI
jgi:hypothetical protein